MRTNEKEYQILLSLPNDTEIWQQDGPHLIHFLESEGFSIFEVNSSKEVISAINTHNFDALIILSDWALEIRLMGYIKGKIPTICLISQETWQNYHKTWFDELFHPPTHEYIALPTDLDQLLIRLNKVLYHSK